MNYNGWKRNALDPEWTSNLKPIFFVLNHPRANAPDVSSDLTMTDSRNKTTTVNYVRDTLSNRYGWMALLLDQEMYSLRFETPWISRSLQVTQAFIHSFIHSLVGHISQEFLSFLL